MLTKRRYRRLYNFVNIIGNVTSPSVCRLVGRSAFRNFQKKWEVTLQSSYRSTCFSALCVTLKSATGEMSVLVDIRRMSCTKKWISQDEF